MASSDKVKEFARDYVNNVSRTPEQKRLISAAYFELFGEKLRKTCSTCYIEAIFKILNKMKKQPCSYRLRKGFIGQPFSGGIITNDNLTDKLVEKGLKEGWFTPEMFVVPPEMPNQNKDKILDPEKDIIDKQKKAVPKKKTAKK